MDRIDRAPGRGDRAPAAAAPRWSIAAELPAQGGPLWSVRVGIDTGARRRVRVQWTLDLAQSDAEPEPTAGRLSRWIRYGLNTRPARRVLAPLRALRLRSWVDVRASREPLDEGPAALLPEGLDGLGITPEPDRPVQTWAGPLAGPRPGFAVLSLLQYREPTRRGRTPLLATAAVATAIDEH